jgi:hypothetical protein
MTVVHPESVHPERPETLGAETESARPPQLEAVRPAEPQALRIEAWADPVIEKLGFDPRSWYVEQFWLPLLGPTSTWFVRRVAAGLDMSEEGFLLEYEETARALGLGGRQGRHSPFARAIGRCVKFEVARWQAPQVLGVHRRLPPLPRRYLLRIPPRLQRLHDAWIAAQGRLPGFEEHRRRARRLAVGLLELGESIDTMEAQLLRWGVHPALAHDAVSWALALPEPA